MNYIITWLYYLPSFCKICPQGHNILAEFLICVRCEILSHKKGSTKKVKNISPVIYSGPWNCWVTREHFRRSFKLVKVSRSLFLDECVSWQDSGSLKGGVCINVEISLKQEVRIGDIRPIGVLVDDQFMQVRVLISGPSLIFNHLLKQRSLYSLCNSFVG